MAAIAAELRQPFMPWQHLVADVGCEIDPLTGLPAYREVVVTVPRQSGKSLSLDTRLLTANRGWTSMGEVRVGDQLFHPGGHAVTVTFVSDVQVGHDCFRVTTTDGRSVVADADHLWQVTDKRAERSRGPRGKRSRWFETRVVTTRDMLAAGLSRYATGGRATTTDGVTYSTNEYRFVLPTQELLKSPDVDLPVDPYLLGAWLGNGNSGGAKLTCHADDVEHWVEAISAVGFVPTPRRDARKPNTWTVGITTPPGTGRRSRSFVASLRALGVLDAKHVPAQYLTAGTAQREALLQGLLDTDGSIDAKRGQVEFCAMRAHLAESVAFLARSLGWRATSRTGRAMLNGRDYGVRYRVFFTPKRDDPASPFRMPRKTARVAAECGKDGGRATLSVASIEPVESVPVRCVAVDSPDGLFLAGQDLIPTHNTSLFLSWQIHRCVSPRWAHPQRSAFTAQTGKDARDKWIDELFPLIRNSRLKKLVSAKGARLEINEGMGNESIRFKTGSLIRLLSTSASSGHSKTLHQAVMDELWHDTDDRREQGLRPAMVTIPAAQLLVCSTAGTEASTVLNRKVRDGRAATVLDSGEGVAYFEWSAPDDWDPDDEDSYRLFMPALCPNPPCRCAGPGGGWRHTVTLREIRSERSGMSEPAEFARAYGNRKTPAATEVRWQAVSKADWTTACEDDTSTAIDPVVFALDVTPGGRSAAIAVVGARADGDLHGELVDHRPGTGWLVPRVVDLVRKWRPARLMVDGRGAAYAHVPDLIAALVPELLPEVSLLSSRDVAGAFLLFRQSMAAQGDSGASYQPPPDANGDVPAPVPIRRLWLRERSPFALSAAAESATTRRIGDGTTWDRREVADGEESVDISPLVAVTNALLGFVSRPVEAAPPPPSTAPVASVNSRDFFRPSGRLRI